jgi:hypothetical protein
MPTTDPDQLAFDLVCRSLDLLSLQEVVALPGSKEAAKVACTRMRKRMWAAVLPKPAFDFWREDKKGKGVCGLKGKGGTGRSLRLPDIPTRTSSHGYPG